MDLGLGGKVAVVTGASKGIGLAVASELAAEGATVVAGSRTIDSLQGLERVTPVAVGPLDPPTARRAWWPARSTSSGGSTSSSTTSAR